ncbi:MAG: bifunctional hydroxymethylpyrimidine kinase/phosphomethylpyrimidine kinase [Xanthomonadales bacterium]|nr:bifunctional hydroxymethylpyrimidine kinase/phosphomethylpyrimidine kinase [Xanthomonadales bacterium]
MPPADPRPHAVLTIAGSDSGGGAGIQADLKTIAAHGLHGVCAITAITAQHTRGVTAVHVVPARMIEAQVEAVHDDFRLAAVKIGMLGTARSVRAVARALQALRGVPLVLDPVMIASSGARLLAADAVRALRERLFPLASVITPNVPEAEFLLGIRIRDARSQDRAAERLRAAGAAAVLLKGGHLPGRGVRDLYLDAGGATAIRHARLARNGHGTGCTLAAALACRLARGERGADAARGAIDYVHGALRHATRPGRGAVDVLDHFRGDAVH